MVRRCIALLPAALALLSSAAFAHVGLHAADDFVAGFAHPISGADHFVAMFAIGVLAGRWRLAAALSLPICFIIALVVGALLGQRYSLNFSVEPMVAGSLVALGLLMIFRANLAVSLTLVAVSGALHGYVHGVEMPTHAVVYPVGFVAASALLHAVGAAFVALIRRVRSVDLVGATGKAITVAGCAMTLATIYA